MKEIPSTRSVLLLLTAAFVLNHLDRHILNITLNDIGVEFNLTDLQLGTLSGVAFAVIYVLLGFPIAKLCRQGQRKFILVSALGVWSVMTALMGLATNYMQILMARVGVGMGEAGCVPASHSMISDAYPPEKRASAFAFYSAGANVGIFLSFIIGGFVASTYGWRMAFFVAGIPGILLAIAMVFLLKEPEQDIPESKTGGASYRTVIGILFSDKTTRHVIWGSALTAMVGYGAIAWIAAFLTRTHGLPLPHIGLYLAVVVGLLGALGTWAGGVLADRLGRTKPELRLRFVAITILIAKPFAVLFYLLDSTAIALIIFIIPAIVGAMFTGPTFAHVYSKLAAEQRAMATAIMMFILNLVGLGIGPVLVGFISDMFSASQGQNSLRFALAIIQIAGLWGGLHFWLAARAIKQVA